MTVRVLPLAVIVPLLAVAALVAEEEASKGRPDSEIGLRGVGVFDVAVPPPVRENTADPGEASLPDRLHDELPPVVPHGVADFLPITLLSNACVDCHEVEAKEPGEPTPLPESHFRDLRNAPDERGDSVAGARWICLSCHVAPTSTGPLVANPYSSGELSEATGEESAPADSAETKRPPVEP